MFDHFVMLKLKPESKKDMPEIVRRLEGLQARVLAIRKSTVYMNKVWGPHSCDLMFHIQLDSEEAFKKDYMLHPEHVPVQHYIEAQLESALDLDIS